MTTPLLPLELAVAAGGVLFVAGDTVHVWGGKRRERLRWIHRARVLLPSPGELISSPSWYRTPRPCPPVLGTDEYVKEDRSGGTGSP